MRYSGMTRIRRSILHDVFRNEEDKEKALLVLDGFMFKGNKLKAVR